MLNIGVLLLKYHYASDNLNMTFSIYLATHITLANIDVIEIREALKFTAYFCLHTEKFVRSVCGLHIIHAYSHKSYPYEDRVPFSSFSPYALPYLG